MAQPGNSAYQQVRRAAVRAAPMAVYTGRWSCGVRGCCTWRIARAWNGRYVGHGFVRDGDRAESERVLAYRYRREM